MAKETNLYLSPLILKNRRGAIFSSLSLDDSDELSFSNCKDSNLIQLFSRAVKNNVLFDHLDEKERIEIFNTMSLKIYSANEIIIQQGDKGEHFYIIEQGEVLVYIDNKLIKTINEGTCFGELALIHGTPRTATVQAKNSVKIWSLLGDTYRRILMNLSKKKRILYDQYLRQIPILKNLNEYQRLTLIDSIETIEYQNGDIVSQTNEIVDNLFIILEGSAIIYDHHSREIETLRPGDYFGQMTCLCNQDVVSQIITKEYLKCMKINRHRFERVLGPIEDLMKKNLLKSNSMMSFEHI